MSAATASSYAPLHTSSKVFSRSLRHEVLVSYLVVITKRGATYGAHLPDVLGCIATSTSLERVRQLIKDGLLLHLEGILEDGDELPFARTTHFSSTPEEEEEEVEHAIISLKMPISSVC